MKKTILIVISVIMFVSCGKISGDKSISINSDWKFITGDSALYSNPTFEDSQWKTIKSDKIWEAYGYDPYDGYAWYRLKIVIPSSLKTSAALKDSLRFFMGKINNFDQTFINGQYLGSNNKTAFPGELPDENFIKAPQGYWDLERHYVVAAEDPRIKWDQENVIAVRVFDEGGQGGLYTGNQQIKMTGLADYLKFDTKSTLYTFKDGNLSKSFIVKNVSASYSIKGKISINAVNKVTGEQLYTLKEKVTFSPGDIRTFTVSFPQPDNSALVTSVFTFDKSGTELKNFDESPYITTPVPPSEPRINGAKVFGARPGSPFLFTIPATGERPMKFSASNLPEGLVLDSSTGIIKGKVSKTGKYNVSLTAENSNGKATRDLIIEIGNRIALTPPMGWNSWNCWGLTVDEGKVIASAKTFKEKGLMNHGWTYINIDDGWEIPAAAEPKREKNGDIITNSKFPNMKALGDSIHSLGLKFGIYSSPGPLTCGGYTASYQYELNDARSYAKWGIDYLKYDWCSYSNIAKDTTLAEYKKPYFVMREALNKANRDIVYSLCQYGMADVWKWGDEVGGNLWRTTGDITDTWESLSEIGFSQISNAPYAKPGNWNDPDMLIVGWVGWGPSLHPTKLTPDEQYTHITLWSLLSAPLLIGCDLTRLDDFTLNLLTNDEVIAIDQDPLGSQAVPVIKNGDFQVWVKNLSDGSRAIGIFNLGTKTNEYELKFAEIGISGNTTIKDLWRQKAIGLLTGSYKVVVPSHGVILISAR
jgi:alpha-galactosidase